MTRVFAWNSSEPGPEVTHVRDSDGAVWHRVPGGWVCELEPAGETTDWSSVLLCSSCEFGVVDCSHEYRQVGIIWPDGTVTGNSVEPLPDGTYLLDVPPGGYVGWDEVWAEKGDRELAQRLPVTAHRPGRDWHATYLTDPRVMAAAQARVAETGEDGWAAAYTLALSMPPAFGCYDAVGARDVLVPDSLPDLVELEGLERSEHGYYGASAGNIDVGNADLMVSMLRRARPGEKVRPDLVCPHCRGPEDDTGVVNQVYRCPACGESWITEAEPADHYQHQAGTTLEVFLDADRATVELGLRDLYAAGVCRPVDRERVWVTSNPGLSDHTRTLIMNWYGRAVDGAATWTWEPDGDPIVTSPDGELPSGVVVRQDWVQGATTDPAEPTLLGLATGWRTGELVIGGLASGHHPLMADEAVLLDVLEAVRDGLHTVEHLLQVPMLAWLREVRLIEPRPSNWTFWNHAGPPVLQLTPTGRAWLLRRQRELGRRRR